MRGRKIQRLTENTYSTTLPLCTYPPRIYVLPFAKFNEVHSRLQI